MGLDGGFLKFTRLEPRHEPVEERIKHFNEFIAIYSDTEGREQASRCMDCGIPFCQHQCPLHNTMPDTQQYVSDGDWESAWRVLDSTNSFPEITGRICPAPCEEGCTLGLHRDAVSIKAIEKKIAEVAFSRGYVTPQPAAASTGCSVAVVGSGPAGLAAAQQLARMGHAVTVYEKMDKPGGLLRYGIPDFKLGKKVVDRRLDQLVREGVRFVLSTRVTGTDGETLEPGVHDDAESTISISALQAKYDAVVLALGAEVPRDLKLPGRELAGIHFALDFLIAQNRVNSGGGVNPVQVRGKHVVVIGGGETASDCIGTANRLGAASVTQLDYHAELPLKADLMREWPDWRHIKRTSTSQEEGCTRLFATNTVSFEGKNAVESVKTVQVKWGPGRKITPIEGTESEVKADVVLIAMGYAHPSHAIVKALGLATDKRGSIAAPVDGPEAWRTAAEGIFAAGDGRFGQSLVVNALAEGRECAAAVDKWLRDKQSEAAPQKGERSGNSCPGRPGASFFLRKEASVAWIYLLAAGILEALWAVAMKASNGFTLLIPSLITVLAMIGSVALLALAMRTLPLGTAYVVWTGIGAVGAFAAGVVMFGESLSLMRVTAAGFIVVGLIMMKASA